MSRTALTFTLLTLMPVCTLTSALPAQEAPRPNILLAIADDWGLHAGAYGTPWVRTPAFDRVVREGALFTQAICAAPSCTPSRAAILTGRNPWQLEDGASLWGTLPAHYVVYPGVLEAAGYHIGRTEKGWAPGDYAAGGRTRNPAGPAWNAHRLAEPPTKGILPNDYARNFEAFLADREPGQPFCFWYGGFEPHRPYEEGAAERAGWDPARVAVPGWLFDTPETRRDLLDYAQEVEHFDTHLGRMLDYLAAAGELDNTLVIVTSDNGLPFPRAKANLYDAGMRVPLAVRWPARITAGTVIDAPVSLVDIAPTVYAATGAAGPDGMAGRSWLGLATGSGNAATPDFAIGGRERHAHARRDNLGYPSRCLRTANWLYIRNFAPERAPAGDAPLYADIDNGLSKRALLDGLAAGVLPDDLRERILLPRPAEELYDLQADPDNLHNLAEDPAHSGRLAAMRECLLAELVDQRDPRALGYGVVFDAYPHFNPNAASLGGFSTKRAVNPVLMREAVREVFGPEAGGTGIMVREWAAPATGARHRESARELHFDYRDGKLRILSARGFGGSHLLLEWRDTDGFWQRSAARIRDGLVLELDAPPPTDSPMRLLVELP